MDYSIAFTLNTGIERFSNWLEHEASRRFFRNPIENKDGSHIVIQPMRHEHRKHVTVCSFEGVYEPAGDNRVAKLMGVIFKFELMLETHPSKFEVRAICKRKGAMSAYATALVAIALTYPESKETIMQQVGVDDSEAVTMVEPDAGDDTKETNTGDWPRKYGPSRHTDARKTEVVHKWDRLNKGVTAVTLPEFLISEFGEENGVPNVPTSTFYSWRKKFLK